MFVRATVYELVLAPTLVFAATMLVPISFAKRASVSAVISLAVLRLSL